MSNRRTIKPTAQNQAFRMEVAENKICSIVGRKLQEQYPGYHWLVEVTWESGVAIIKNLNLDGDYGFIIHLKDLEHDTDLKLVTAAGGELLERCGLPRGAKPHGDGLNHLHRNVRGEVSEKSMDKEVSGREF